MNRREMFAAFGALIASSMAARSKEAQDYAPQNTTEGPDLDFHASYDGRGLRQVYLDGRPMDQAINAHVRDGWVEVYCKDERGNYIISEDGGLVSQHLYGRVTVKYLT